MSQKPHLTFDLDEPGVNKGYLVVPTGTDREALPLPVLSLNKGEGPRLLITAGIHGDEFEGPIVALRLIDWLIEAQTCGRVLIAPMLNPTALEAWSRRSPVDRLDLNRVFPGRPNGSISERTASAVSELLLPTVDMVFDLHSFGPKFDCPPAATTHPIGDADLMRKTLNMAAAFKFPVTLAWDGPTQGMFDTLVQSQGKVFVCAELGSGTVSADALAVAEAGVRNAIIELGLVEGKTEYPTPRQMKTNLTLESLTSDQLTSPARGIFEPRCSVLDELSEGDLVGLLHPLDPWSSKAIEIRASTTSIVCSLRTGMQVDVNDGLVYLARPLNL
ncbi:MAG: peptidase M14 [Mesorhizobium sp.]|nr:MAG: peptidase M14 [Mesorhizobium sp.]TJW62133.1 MAG: succinylglutamate desuccinylase/aspartoacylase family protein [Mesorhizobium sp.]